MCLALTWLNPHVYLDTLILLGAISTRFPGQEASFAAGAMTGLVRLFLLAWLWREMVAADFCKPLVLARAGGAHRRHHVGDRPKADHGLLRHGVDPGRLNGLGRDSLRTPCFAVGERL